MFAYCGNHPTTQFDPHGNSGELVLQWSVYASLLTLIDGPLPIGDIIYVGGIAVCGILDFVNTVGVENLAFVASEGPNAAQNLVNQISNVASNPPPGGPEFKEFIQRYFRENLQILTGITGEGMQAHHVLPVHFIEKFTTAGINIHDPMYGAWVDSSVHLSFSYDYSAEWEAFFSQYANPTQVQILDFARELAQKYGVEIYF